MIVIVDYGMGNLGSLLNMFKRVGISARIESDPVVIEKAAKIVLPGVGAFDAAMTRINNLPGLREVLDRKAIVQKIPILGVCLGMQLLTGSSEEGRLPGLGWIPGRARIFPRVEGLPVPHMGWNAVSAVRSSPITDDLGDGARFYFVHSYYVRVDDERDSLLKASYGLLFDAAVVRDNVFGVQFHPEKSHRFGMKLLSNFAQL